MKRNRGILSNQPEVRGIFNSRIPAASACFHNNSIIYEQNTKKLEGNAFKCVQQAADLLDSRHLAGFRP